MNNLLEHENGLKFENIYPHSKSMNQEKYKYFENLLSPIKGIGYNAFNNSKDILEPCQAKPNSVFIFDDVACA